MRFISLTKGLWATVDDEDYDGLVVYKWHARQASRHNFYAARMGPHSVVPRKVIYMHHEVSGGRPETGFEIDHIDGDGLNNQRGNLRLATRCQNSMNRHSKLGNAPYRGITWYPRYNKWRAQIRANCANKTLGYFSSAEDGARAYDAAAREAFGEFAILNFEV